MESSEPVAPDQDDTARNFLPHGSLPNNESKPWEEEEGDLGESAELPLAIKNSGESLEETPAEIPQVGKPQVVVRIRPSSSSQNVTENVPIFEVDQQAKTIQIRVEREERRTQGMMKHRPPPTFIYFPADEIVEDSNQLSTFTAVAEDVVEKAMVGIPGMIVAIGPEMSGKSFTLFGLSGIYQNRGIAIRALEKMFDLKDRKQGELDFKFGMGIVEIRRERIRDLLTLSSNEINEIGDRGPKGMYIEEIDCLENGIGLMLRALIGQKLIHQEPFERFHTIVYLEILAVNPVAPELVQYQSRITIVEIASASSKIENIVTGTNSRISLLCGPNESMCLPPPSFKTDNKLVKLLKPPVFPPKKCCNPGQTQGPLAESIAVRRDVFALEQIFLRANETNRIRKYFAKMETLGLSMIASEKKKLSSGNSYRQNKLAHCLKDIMDTNTEIRIILHVRPEKLYLKASLEAMRFAERARLVPSNLDSDPNKGKPNRTEEQILQEVIQDIAPELIHPVNVESFSSEKMKIIQEQAVKYFQNNIEEMKVCDKKKVKSMFENFRVLWNFLWELELNLTLQKAEEEMKQAVEKMNIENGGRRRSDGKRGSDAGNVYEGEDEEQIEKVLTKKSTKKLKKEKDRKRRKDKLNQQQQGKRISSYELKADDSKLQDKRGSTADGMAGAEEGGEDQNELAGPRLSQTGDDDKQAFFKGETEVANTSPPDTTEQQQVEPSIIEGENSKSRPSIVSVTSSIKKGTIAEESMDLLSGTVVNEIPSLTGETVQESIQEVQNVRSSTENDPKKSNTANGDGLQKRNSTIVADEGYPDAKMQRYLGSNNDDSEKRMISDEERAQMAAQQEQQIAENFEEMKKIARRQAIHLLRAGIRRPQWMSQF